MNTNVFSFFPFLSSMPPPPFYNQKLLGCSVLRPLMPGFLPIPRMVGGKQWGEGELGFLWVTTPLEINIVSIPSLDIQKE